MSSKFFSFYANLPKLIAKIVKNTGIFLFFSGNTCIIDVFMMQRQGISLDKFLSSATLTACHFPQLNFSFYMILMEIA